MKLVKALWRSVTTLLLHFSLFGLVGSIIFVQLIGNTNTIKYTLEESGVYDNFVQSVIDANLETAQQDSTSIPLDDPALQKLVKEAFDPQSLQASTESVIDSVESWLHGETKDLTFSFDLAENKQRFATLISAFAIERLEALPTCSSFPSETNVFRISCLPPDTDLESLRTSLRKDFFESDSFLKESTITEKNLPLTSDGKRIDEKLSFAPSIFQILQNGVVIFAIAFIVSCALFVFARKPRRRGVKALGRDLATNGIMLLIFTVLFGYVLPRYTNNFSLNVTGNEVAEISNNVTELFIRKLDILVINIAIQIAVVGIVILVIERFTRSSDIYAKVYEKSGIATSDPRRKSDPTKPQKRNEAPLQTSETPKHPAKKTVQKSKKYRKIQL